MCAVLYLNNAANIAVNLLYDIFNGSRLIMSQRQPRHLVVCYHMFPKQTIKLKWTRVCIFLVFCCGEVASQGGKKLDCPGEFVDGTQYTLKCFVSETAVTNAVCAAPPPSVDFQLFDESSLVLLASSSYPACNTNWNGDARCESYDSATKVHTYEFRLLANKSTQGGKSLRCWMTCLIAGGSAPSPFTLTDSVCPIQRSSSSLQCPDFTLEWRGIVLLCVGTALVIAGVIMMIADILGKVGIAVSCPGYILLIAGIVLMTVAYRDDEPEGVAFLWVVSILLIILGIVVLITAIVLPSFAGKGDSGGEKKTHKKTKPTPDGGETELETTPRHGGDRSPASTDRNHRSSPQNGTGAHSTTDSKEGPCLSVLAKVGIALNLSGCTLAIIGGIVAATEPCPSDVFPTTIQEKLGLALAVIGFAVFLAGFIIVIAGLCKKKRKPGHRDGKSTSG